MISIIQNIQKIKLKLNIRNYYILPYYYKKYTILIYLIIRRNVRPKRQFLIIDNSDTKPMRYSLKDGIILSFD